MPWCEEGNRRASLALARWRPISIHAPVRRVTCKPVSYLICWYDFYQRGDERRTMGTDSCDGIRNICANTVKLMDEMREVAASANY